MLKAAIVAFLFAVLGATAGWAQAPDQSEIRLNVPYGPDPAHQLDLCLPPAAPPGPNPAGQRPAVVMLHGGYWTVGDKSAYAQLCKMAADQGIVAASINYRLANASEHNRWPAQLVDAQLAVRWLRFHAREFGVDPKRICALGDSAGAHLAVFLAVLDRTTPGDYAGDMPGVSSNVACAVDNFGAVDLTTDTLWPPDKQLFGSDDQARPTDKEREASPLFLVGPRTSPIMIAHGREDKSVNISQSVQLLDALKSAHVPARMTVLECGHEFSGLSIEGVQAVYQAELDFIKGARMPGNKSR
jgi:acetyl esterase/lipase